VSVLVRGLALPLVAGAACVFGFAPFYAWPVPIAALAILFYVFDSSRSPRQAALSGFAFGLCLERPDPRDRALAAADGGTVTRPLVLAPMLLILATTLALYDYMRVVVIFAPPAGAAPLADRIADGRRSVLFSQHADYAAATTAEHPSQAMWAFNGAPHYLLDARLMQAWAVALQEAGDTDRARHVAARLKEFKSDQAETFFAPCDDAAEPEAKRPFQCDPPSHAYSYLDFR